jgi:hypothetical protein
MLRTAREQQLDPLQEEVQAIRFGLGWQVHISMEGWLKLLHRHPHFSGITFTPSPEETPLPTWMECTIYRSDRAVPTTVREYYQEVKQDAPLWDKMPRRMLRHRTLQQCARVALGVGTIGATGDDSVTNDHCPVDDLRMNPTNGLPTLDRDQPEQPQAINLSLNAIPSKRSEHNINPSSSQTDRLKSKLSI